MRDDGERPRPSPRRRVPSPWLLVVTERRVDARQCDLESTVCPILAEQCDLRRSGGAQYRRPFGTVRLSTCGAKILGTASRSMTAACAAQCGGYRASVTNVGTAPGPARRVVLPDRADVSAVPLANYTDASASFAVRWFRAEPDYPLHVIERDHLVPRPLERVWYWLTASSVGATISHTSKSPSRRAPEDGVTIMKSGRAEPRHLARGS
jgi:hypothetical protein